MTDSEIVALYWERNENAITLTKEKYGRFCTRIAINILGTPEDAGECVNDTYLKAWQSMPPHKPEILSAFLAKITRALSISRLRRITALKRSSKVSVSFDELNDCLPAKGEVYEKMEAEELKVIIEAFLNSQKDMVRNIFICRYFYGDSIADISLRFHCTQSKVKTTLHRTRVKLKEYLIKEGVFDE